MNGVQATKVYNFPQKIRKKKRKIFYQTSLCLDPNGKRRDLTETVIEFMSGMQNTLVLCGDPGGGKSTFLKYYAKLKNKRKAISINLIELNKKLNLNALILYQIKKQYGISLTFTDFKKAVRQGKFVILIDDFDAISTGSLKKVSRNLAVVQRLAFNNSKIILTCNSHFVYTDIHCKRMHDNFTPLFQNQTAFAFVRILPQKFNPDRLMDIVSQSLEDAGQTTAILKIITNEQVAGLVLPSLKQLRTCSDINMVSIFDAYTNLWIKRHDFRAGLKPPGKKRFLWVLAEGLSELKNQISLQHRQKTGPLELHHSKLAPPFFSDLRWNYEKQEQDFYKFDAATCPFVIRSNTGCYCFIHKAFMDYFLADYYYNMTIKGSNKSLSYSKFNKATRFFLVHILKIHKTELQNTDLSGLQFDGMNFNHALLQGAKLYRASFIEAKLKNAVLINADLSHTRFVKADLRGADLSQTNLFLTDFSNSRLEGVSFEGANLLRSNLMNAALDRADLSGANLGDVNFTGANLKTACLRDADLRTTIFQRTCLQGADLSNANLLGVNLNDVNLAGANLSKANLGSVDLSRANLTQANLEWTNLNKSYLTGVDLHNANLQHANLQRTNLQRANLTNCDLRNANLIKADLRGANLTNADLRGADLWQTNMNDTNLSEAISDPD